MITVACDGAALGNPAGPGGWGWYVSDRCWQAGAEVQASNNAMELTALLRFLQATAHLAPDTPITVVLDSTYVRDSVTKWVVAWERNGWMTSARKPVKNAELIRPIVAALRSRPGIALRWTKGHSGHPLNEAADHICTSAARAIQEGTVPQTGPGWVDAESTDVGHSGSTETGPVSAAETVPDPAATAAATQPAARSPEPAARRTPAPAESLVTSLLLLRHGETPHSIERRFSGSSDLTLTSNGLAQAIEAANRFAGSAPIAAIISSPLQRARQTAAEVGSVLGLPIQIDPDLREVDFGEWEGLTYAEASQRDPAAFQAWIDSADVAPPGGESLTSCLARLASARSRLLESHPRRRILVVTHVTPIKLLIGDALGAVTAVLRRMTLDLCSLSRVDYLDGKASVRLVNDVSHLGPP